MQEYKKNGKTSADNMMRYLEDIGAVDAFKVNKDEVTIPAVPQNALEYSDWLLRKPQTEEIAEAAKKWRNKWTGTK